MALPATQASHEEAPAFMGVYMNDPAISLTIPSGTATKKAPMAPAQAGLPAAATPISSPGYVFPEIPVPFTFKVATRVEYSLWLSASQTVPFQGFQFDMSKFPIPSNPTVSVVQCLVCFSGPSGVVPNNPASLIRDASGNPVLTLGTTPTHFVGAIVPSPLPNPEFKKDEKDPSKTDKITLRLSVFGTGADNDNAPKVYVHYGSAALNSGFTFGVDKGAKEKTLNIGSYRAGNSAIGIYLGESALEFKKPLVGTDKKKHLAIEDLATIDEAPEMELGTGSSPIQFTAASDGVFTGSISLETTGSAAAHLQLKLNLYVGDTQVANGTTGFRVEADISTTAAQAPANFTIGLPTYGILVGKGAALKLTLQVFGANPNDYWQLTYGTATYPSGLLMGIKAPGHVGGAAAATSSTTASSSSTTTSSSSSSSTTPTSSTSPAASLSASATAAAGGEAGVEYARNLSEPQAKAPGAGFAVLVVAMGLGLVLLRRRS